MNKIISLMCLFCFTIHAQNMFVSSGNSFTIEKGSSVSVSGDFSNTGTFTLNSDADEFSSIIVGGSSSGDIVYNRYVNTVGSGEWDLVGSPVGGLSIDDFATTNSSSSAIAQSGSTYALGAYDNLTNSWTNFTDTSVTGAGNLNIGTGYQMASVNGETLAFTGTIATTDQVQSIINSNGSGGRRWNLVANPFPSYLKVTNDTDATDNFLKVNSESGVIDGTFSAIYGWNADGSGYTPYNHTSGSVYLAPGQGFFVAAASASSSDLSFTEAMQTVTGGDDFVAGRMANTSSSFHLKLYEDQDFIAETKFYFDSNLTLGLDPGYDAGAFDQTMALMSRLIEDDQGVGMRINAMGQNSLNETTIIPLVVNQSADTAFRISLEDATIPSDVNIYLEDTQTNTYTDLRSGDFTLTAENNLSDMGRFYLVVGNNSLGENNNDVSYISIYKAANEDYITIEGLVNFQQANVRLYNVVGQEVLRTKLITGQAHQRVSTEGLNPGLYVMKLKVDDKKITKKLIIN